MEKYEFGKRVKLEHEKLFDLLMKHNGVVVPNAYLLKLDELLKQKNIEYTAEKVDKYGSQYIYRLIESGETLNIDTLKKSDKVMIVYENDEVFNGYVSDITPKYLTLHEYVSDISRTFIRNNIIEISKLWIFEPYRSVVKGEKFVKKFDGVTDALREVKRLSSEISTHGKIYVAYNEYYERYIVTDDNDELSEEIHQQWCNSGCDSKPEDEAKEYKVWEYSKAENKEKYPNTYRRANKSLINSVVPLIRRSMEVECEYSVEFVVGY